MKSPSEVFHAHFMRESKTYRWASRLESLGGLVCSSMILAAAFGWIKGGTAAWIFGAAFAISLVAHGLRSLLWYSVFPQ